MSVFCPVVVSFLSVLKLASPSLSFIISTAEGNFTVYAYAEKKFINYHHHPAFAPSDSNSELDV